MLPEKMEIEKYKIDNIVKKEEKFYLQIKYRKRKESGHMHYWCMTILPENFYADRNGIIACPEQIVFKLVGNAEGSLLSIVEDNWYFRKGKEAYVYNEEWKTFKVIRQGDPEWNCF